MTEIAVGQYAVIPGYSGASGVLSPDIHKVVRITEKLVFLALYGTRQRQVAKTDVLASFDSEDDAQKLVSKLAGIKGEQDRRIVAAQQAASKAAHAAIASARQGETK